MNGRVIKSNDRSAAGNGNTLNICDHDTADSLVPNTSGTDSVSLVSHSEHEHFRHLPAS